MKRKIEKKKILSKLLQDKNIFKKTKKLVLEYVRPELEDIINNSEHLDFTPENLRKEDHRSELYVKYYLFFNKKIFTKKINF